ncbi:MAG TPA: hypothetical protein VFJ16_12320 [Longimicrobium sp.]|nr:hypothetical protein [Longimicrobium sp.]
MTHRNQAATFDRPITASLARVLAEAANGAFTPGEFYVVCRYEADPDPTDLSPFDVQAPCATHPEAVDLVEQLSKQFPGVAYGIFGPFVSELAPVRVAEVAHISVTPRIGGELRPPIEIDGHTYDALFYSPEAVRKFVIPYYSHVVGPEYAAEMLKTYMSSELGLMGHLPWSEEVELVPNRQGPPPPGPK